ncbi:conserved exported protein of unknown function [Tenacibaculum sp. 190130A14a]|uniref:DUF3857 domain-containing protein n=1 Tax=Tenacibaculum polynesiense TaxID=3137857 RepID=A0ABP1F0V4_9FLAO
MKKKLLLILLCVSALNSMNSQELELEKENIAIKYHWTKEISKNSIWTPVKLNTKSKNKLKRIYVKVKMMTLDKTKRDFDINKFILLDVKNKLKIRPTDISYQYVASVIPFNRLSKDKNVNVRYGIRYDDTVKDSFIDFDFPGYNTFQVPINYGTTKSPELHITYFEPEAFKKRRISIFFTVPFNVNTAELYYGNEKLTDIEF